MIRRLFHLIGYLLGEQRKQTDRERYREKARQMNIAMGRPIPKALRR